MSPLNNSRLFHLLAESSQQHATKAAYEQAYNEFVEQLIFYCKQEVNPTLLLQNLHMLRIELNSFETVNLICESKKKCSQRPFPN
ncbi:hypothetical protein GGR21_000697 [Dysgonomonas hofstadii]|uniref:Uncharacterized protein n=1 Tax=Dysgonomonas hofstadii TaxID=637886 RepID=A0A840CFR1_9BACT|nr:hypothetical protein [Dysgonomonas hofstadii]MBB4034810.1 hypothetical protein [Dysgonomonas hofstadii]